MASLYNDIFDAAVADIKALGLTGLTDDRVIVWPIPDARGLTRGKLPCVFVGLTGEAEIEVAAHSTNLRDAWRYPVGIYTLHRPAPGQASYATEIEQSLAWRQTMRNHFHRTGSVAAGVTGGVDQTVTPVQPIDPGLWLSDGLMVGGLVLHVTVREDRDA